MEYKVNIKDRWEFIYKIIKLFFDNKIKDKDLDKIDIFELTYIIYFIELYIKEIIINKFKNLNNDDIELEESIFDEYDKENGYVSENNTNIYDDLQNALNSVFRFSIKQCKNSIKESMDMSICDLLDYVKDEIQYLEDHKEDEEDY